METKYEYSGCWLQDLIFSQAEIFKGIGDVGINLPAGVYEIPGTIKVPKNVILSGQNSAEKTKSKTGETG